MFVLMTELARQTSDRQLKLASMTTDASKSTLQWLIVAAVLFAIAIGATGYLSLQFAEADRATIRSYLQREKLKECLSALQDVETGDRGYALTRDPKYLEPYYIGRKNFPVAFEEAKRLTSDDQQRVRLDELSKLAQQKLEFASRTLPSREIATKLILSGEGKRLMDACRVKIAELNARSGELVSERMQRMRMLESLVWTTTTILGLFGMVMLVSVYNISKRALGLEQQRSKELGLINDKLQSEIEERKRTETALRELSARLESSNRDLQQFAYVASHDLQEPLRAVAGFLTLIAKKHSGKLGEESEGWINHAVEGAQRMRSLINDLLAYARVESRGKELQQFDLDKSLNQAKKDLSVLLEETGAVVEAHDMPTVSGDEKQLAQVFVNLIGNAVKFRDKDRKPVVTIEVSKDEREYTVAVRDNGIGFDQEHAERIFIIFQRLQGREEYSGTGIGLSICKKIIERHNGRIWAESAPGKGSTFYFTLPIV